MFGLRATLLGALDCLNRFKVYGFISVCIDKSDAEYLKPPLRRSGAAGPEVSLYQTRKVDTKNSF